MTTKKTILGVSLLFAFLCLLASMVHSAAPDKVGWLIYLIAAFAWVLVGILVGTTRQSI